MNKSDLAREISQRTGLTKKKSEQIITEAIDIITGELENGGKVQLAGFGAFEVKHRAARTGRNPRTKEPILVPAYTTPVFRAGKTLKQAITDSITGG